MSYRKLLLLRTWRTSRVDAWRNKTTGLHEYTFNFKAWSLINDRWPHQQLLYTTLIFRAGLSRKEATVGGGSSASTAAAASCGIWAFLESTEHRDAKLAYESLFSRCLCSGLSTISVSLFFQLFISLFNLHCVCSVLESLVVSPAILLEFFQSLLLLCPLLFILRSSEFVSVAVSQLFSVLEMELPWFPSSNSILIVPFLTSRITAAAQEENWWGGHWTPAKTSRKEHLTQPLLSALPLTS